MLSENIEATGVIDETQTYAYTQENKFKNYQILKGLHKCHDLPFTVKQVNDYVPMIYDVANPLSKCKLHIPDGIQCHKNYSIDYVNCIQQNGTNYGFLPLND